MIDDSVYTYTAVFQESGKSEKDAMFLACSNAANEYYKMISPGKIAASRYYYPKGDTTLLKGDTAVRAGKWGRAEARWKWLSYNSPDTILQAKASYNMALCCERDGRLNQAMGFAKRSQRLNPDKHTLAYIGILNKRIQEFEEMVNQKKIIKKW
jgi:tetratricopeptide (TPR) repeat protein